MGCALGCGWGRPLAMGAGSLSGQQGFWGRGLSVRESPASYPGYGGAQERFRFLETGSCVALAGLTTL